MRSSSAGSPIHPLFGALLLGAACASPGVIPVQKIGALENPETGVAVKIATVEDQRQFQSFAGRSFTPTIEHDDGDPVRRARAVGRATNRGGGAGYNVWLAPHLSVERVVAESIARALRGAGFRVLELGDAGFEGTVPLRVSVEQLWMMQNAPTSPAYAESEIRVAISGPMPGLERGAVVDVRKKVGRGGWSRGMWRLALEKGLDRLTSEAQRELTAVRASLDASPLMRPSRVATPSALPPAPRHSASPIDFGSYHLLAIGIDACWNDEEAGLGYWLPVDAERDDETNWVSNAKITSIPLAMRAKHVMVISDSCYSGTLTRGIAIQRRDPGYLERLAARRTRLVLASGGNEPVADGGGGAHSVFAAALLRALEENSGVLDATTLHAKIRTPVLRDSDQTPQFGPIRRARHEDGDFLLIRSP